MNSKHGPRLDALLQEWQPQADLPPRFESEVWRRIALAQEKPASWLNFDWVFRITNQPKLAFAIVMSAVVLGTGLATLQAQQNYHQEIAASKIRYIQSVDPFANTLLASNP
jgi:hypothetical protein